MCENGRVMSECDAPSVGFHELVHKKGRKSADMRPGSPYNQSGVRVNDFATDPLLCATGPKVRAAEVVCAERPAFRAHRHEDLVTAPASKQPRELR